MHKGDKGTVLLSPVIWKIGIKNDDKNRPFVTWRTEMQYRNLQNLKVSQIQIFLTAVECSSLSRAADLLHVTQPMVTKTIQTLEHELGIILFIRTKGRLVLTPAGKECYEQWHNIMILLERSVESAHSIQEGQGDRLRIGMGILRNQGMDFLERIQKYKNQYHAEVFMEKHPMSFLLRELQKDCYDAGLISRHLLDDVRNRGLEWKLAYSSCLAVFVPLSNPLSKKDQLHFSDLKSESFIAFSSETDPQYLNLLNNLAMKEGFIPRISCYVTDESSFEPNLILGNGVALIDSMINLDPTQIRKYDLKDLPNNIILVWKDSNPNPNLTRFLSLF